jgi:hypothetical protein
MQLAVVIPNYNGIRHLVACLASLRRQTVRGVDLVVVDNGSGDGSADFLRRHHPEVTLIDWRVNRGFAAAVNAGIRQCRSRAVFLLNNDTELAPDCLGEILSGLERFPDALFFALKILNFHDRGRLDGAGDGVFLAGAGYRLGTLEPDGAEFDCPRRVFGACAGAAVYRREFFERVGFFDEDYFAYLEDVDLNLRAARLGVACRYLPRARVFHVGSATTGSILNPFTVRLSTRNLLFNIAKNYPSRLLWRIWPQLVLYHLVWLLYLARKGHLAAWRGGVVEAVRGLRTMRRRFAALDAMARTTPREFQRVLQASENEVLAAIVRRRRREGKFVWPLRLYRHMWHGASG